MSDDGIRVEQPPTDAPPGLGRVRHFDERSRQFAVRSVIPRRAPRRVRLWGIGEVLDQGREGACVGFAWTGELQATPKAIRRPRLGDPNAYARAVYREAQTIDPWPGENYEGTSVLAGCHVLQRRGFIGEYRWAFGIDDMIDAVCHIGPCVIGIDWHRDMYRTRPSGLVTVSGEVVGGHAILVYGYHSGIRLAGEPWDQRFEVFKWRNSWGPDYGRGGDGYIRVGDMARLLDAGGECCVVSVRHFADSMA